MSYEIKEDGYECRGFKLGQMTNYGKIIGFDTRCVDFGKFIATDNNMNIIKTTICNSEYVTTILSGHENSSYAWFSNREIELIENIEECKEIIPTIQTQLNVIQQIRNVIDNVTVKVEFFSEEFCVSLYDSEIPICWDKQNGLYLLTETMSGNIDHEMMVV